MGNMKTVNMRTWTGLYALVLFTALGISTTKHVNGYECSSCGYAAWNCPPRTNITKAGDETETVVKTNEELRKVSIDSQETPIEVCNALGQIQIDDVFCDSPECTCADDKHCVSLVLGCHNVFQAQSRKRCLGASAIERRFQKCAVAQALVNEETHSVNLSSDWIYFKQAHRCLSSDCQAVRQFHECGVVQCGYLIVAWKDNATLQLIVDGSRASDMVAGTFLFTMALKEASCATITSTTIQDCYSLQTRNQKEGTCDGIYLQLDHTLQLKGEQYNFSKLSWPVWLAVVGSIVCAIAALVMVLVMYVRMRNVRDEDERSRLLLSKSSVDSGNEGSLGGELCDPLTSTSSQTRIQISDLRQRSCASPTHHTSLSFSTVDSAS